MTAPKACAVKPDIPIRKKPKSQNIAVKITAAIPTAPIGVASPICPTTAVSTAPKIGIVALDKTTGNAKNKTRLWVISEDIICHLNTSDAAEDKPF